MARQITQDNGYSDRFLKLIPAELIGAFVVTISVIPTNTAVAPTISMGVFLILLLLVPFHLKLMLGVHSKSQIAASMVSFVIWAFTLGGLSSRYDWWEGYFNSILIALWAIIFPLFKYNTGSKEKVTPHV